MLAAKKREFPKQKPEVLTQAQALEQVGELDKAESLYRDILQGEPDHIQAMMGLARLHEIREFWVESFVMLEYIIELVPEHEEAMQLMKKIESHCAAKGQKIRLQDNDINSHFDVSQLKSAFNPMVKNTAEDQSIHQDPIHQNHMHKVYSLPKSDKPMQAKIFKTQLSDDF